VSTPAGRPRWSARLGAGVSGHAEEPRATWKLNGTLRIRTSDRENDGSLGRPA
jgi:hypothetical protein